VSETKQFIEKNDGEEQWKSYWGERFRQINQNKIEPSYVFSDQPIAVCLNKIGLQIDNSGFAQEIMNGAIYYFYSGKSNNITQVNFDRSKYNLIGFLYAYEFEHQGDSLILSRSSHETSALEQLRKEWQGRSEQVRKEFDALTKNQKEWASKASEQWESSQISTKKAADDSIADHKITFDKIFKQYTDELEGLTKAYKEKLALEAPVEYWRNRATTYETKGNVWLKRTIWATCIVLAIIGACLYLPPEAFKGSILDAEPITIRGIILLAMFISFSAYFIRLLVKMTLSSFHLKRDAEEREQLTLIYLALVKDGKLEKDDRNFVLQSLFSRAETGLLGEDSGPTMPVLERVVR